MEQISVLIADDNDTLRQEIKSEFEKDKSIKVVGEVKTGEEAMKIIREQQPRVVITDLVLSGIDGLSLMEQCQKLENKPRFLVTSALSSETFINKSMELGAFYYMIKPINVSVLKERTLLVASENYVPFETTQAQKNSGIKQLDEKISNIFITVGIPAHIKGYQFLREAIKLATQKPDIINSITKELYPSIAQRFNTSSSKVERAIRHAIEVAWNRGKIENINDIFGLKVYNSNEKPTNGEFIALVADKMLIEG
ncbi:MAG: sporulation transcription factor Spo0A [Clostridia bacterium]|nr:sporulation transcription factor Spo0A [Clostridia bacterium]